MLSDPAKFQKFSEKVIIVESYLIEEAYGFHASGWGSSISNK
jgi:hypothetical protein